METAKLQDQSDMLRYFVECCREKITKEYIVKIEKCLKDLSDEDVWWRAHETNNSIGNIVLHLAGNIRQWVYQYLGENQFQRNRDKEFSERSHIPKDELLKHLHSAVEDVDAVLRDLATTKLSNRYSIQGYDVTGLEVVLHVTEHFSYHAGQIVYITKLRTGKDLKFYNL
jgi:uncharacterized damage-inducible protein DinB